MGSSTVVSSDLLPYFTVSPVTDKFAELLGVTDSTAFRYNAELRRMVSSLQLRHISFVRVQGLLSGRRKSSYLSDLSEAEYLFNAPITREQFLSTDIGNYDAEAHIKSDEGALRTYRGYLRFLKLDLEGRDAQVLKKSSGNQAEQAYLSRKTREKLLSTIAKRMMGNRAVRMCFQPPAPPFISMMICLARNSPHLLSELSLMRCA